MTKKLNTDQIVNDLEGSAFFRRHVGQTPDRPTPQPLSPSTATAQPPHDPPTSPSIDQSTHQSIDQSTKETTNAIVDRPKAFYITQRLDRTLDEAVRYYQDVHGIKKADRSIIINAILDTKSQWTNESLDVLVDRVISQLTSGTLLKGEVHYRRRFHHRHDSTHRLPPRARPLGGVRRPLR